MTAPTSKPANGGTDAPAESSEGERIDDLIRRLVGQIVSICERALPSRGECTREEIIIDTNVDGVRYLVVRMPEAVPSLVALTPREQEIVRMVAKGYPNKTIAGVLNISSWTVCTHLRRIFAKLGVASRAAMVARLLKEGRAWEQSQPNEKPFSHPSAPLMAMDLQNDNASVSKRTVPKEALSLATGQQTLPRQKTGS